MRLLRRSLPPARTRPRRRSSRSSRAEAAAASSRPRRKARRGRRHAAAAPARGRGRAQPDARGTARRSHSVAVRAPAAVSYLRTLAAAQRTLAARLAVTVPDARVHWHYDVALDGVSVVLPASELAAPARGARRDRLADRHLPLAARPRADRIADDRGHRAPTLDRRDTPLGVEPRHRRPGDEDRDHRRRHRPERTRTSTRPASRIPPASRRGTPPTPRRR